jgi:hypothetical protein
MVGDDPDITGSTPAMSHHIGIHVIALILMALAGMVLRAHAHQAPCHRLHSCPPEYGTYVC